MSARSGRRLTLCLCLLVCLNGSACQYFKQDARQGTVRAAGRMQAMRAGHTVTPLQNGLVLIAGGMERAEGAEVNTDTAEMFDPTRNTFTLTARMNARRAGHTATLLKNGDVLIAGGFDEGAMLASAEVFHPAAGTFTQTAQMNARRSGHTATLLADGRVLIAGGNFNLSDVNADAEAYDPLTGRFTPAGRMTTPRVVHSATLLGDNTVLLAGGSARFRSDVLASAERYDPATQTFTPTGPMREPRTKHAAALLPDGRVLIAGGTEDASELTGAKTSAEIYDPQTRTFNLTQPMANARFKIPAGAAVLPDGRVIVGGDSRYVEVFDYHTKRFATARGRTDGAWLYPVVTTLADGRVLITGGYDYDMQVTAGAWLYQPA